MSTGFVLNIPQEMINRLDIADQKIEMLAKTSEDSRNRIIAAFQQINTQGIDAFINRLDTAQQKLTQLGGTQINVGVNAGASGIQLLVDAINRLSQASQNNITINGLGTVGNQANTAVDAINRLITTLQQLQQMGGQQFLGGVNTLGRQTLREMNKEAKKMQKTFTDLEAAIQNYGISATDLANKLQQARQAQQQFNDIAKQQAQADVSGLLGMKGNQKTLNELKNYANELKRTMANLDPKSKEWRDLNKVLQETNNKIRGIQTQMGQFNGASRRATGIISQVGRAISLAFSLSAIRGYVGQLFEMTAQFEMQRKALTVILQNQEDANRIWQQTIDLAVKSPFRVKELVQYTRQLAAYRIESSKLYETNKMLADVSAGLGVDMQRLILAFGQVKAASFLRGTELRQFTEAGIPMLEELAKHFSELEGRVYSVDEVFGMISKRQVQFKDVEQVFKNMTTEGGVFFEMQERMSETLKGRMSNLKDEIDLMLNEIGSSNAGVFSWWINLAKTLVKSWKGLASILTTALTLFAGYQIAATYAAIKTGTLSTATNMLSKALYGVTTAIASVKTAFGPTGWLILGITALVAGIGKYISLRNSAGAGPRADELKQELDEIAERYNRLSKMVVDISASFDKAVDESNIKNQKLKLQELIDIANKEYHMKIQVEIDSLDESEIQQTYNDIKSKLQEAAAISEGIERAWEENAQVIDKVWSGEYGVQIASGKRYKKGISEVNKSLQAYEEDIISVYNNFYTSIKKAATEAGKSLPDTENESLFQWIEDNFAILPEKVKEKLTQLDVKGNARTMTSIRENVVKNLFTVLSQKIDISQVDDPVSAINTALGELIKDAEIPVNAIGDYKKRFEDAFKIELDPINTTRELADWEKGFNDLLKGMQEDISEWLDEDLMDDASVLTKSEKAGQLVDLLTPDNKETRRQLIKRMKEIMDENEAIIKSAAVKGQGAWSELDVEMAKKRFEQAKAAWTFLGGFDKNEGKGKDPVMEKLKQQLAMIKEMNQEFEKLAKDMDKAESESEVRKSFTESANAIGLNIAGEKFDDGGAIDMLQDLLAKKEFQNKEYQTEIKKILDNFLVQDQIDEHQEQRESLKKQVEKLFDRNELTRQVKDLGLGEETAEQIFDFESLSLDDLKAAILSMKDDFEATGENGVKAYESYLKKVEDMEVKAQRERIKTYSKYLLEGMSERVKLKIEELRKLKEIEESKEFTPEQKERIKAGVSQEAKKEQQQQEWKDFKSTDMYTMVFEDLEHYGTAAIEALYKKLTDLKTKLSDLPANEVKDIMSQIEKLENIKIERNPFKEWIKYAKEIKDIGFSQDELQGQLTGLQDREAFAQGIIDVINLVQQAIADGADKATVLAGLTPEQLTSWRTALGLQQQIGGTLGDVAKKQQDVVKKSEEQQGIVAAQLSNYKKLSKAQEQSYKKTELWLNTVGDVFDASKELMTALGVESDSVAMTIADTGSSMVSLILSAVQFTAQLQAMGIAANSALGIIGWVAIALQAVAMVIAAIFSAKDKALEKQVNDNLDQVKELQEKYDGLEEKIDNAWSAASIRQYNKELKTTTQEMIAAQKAAIAAQEQRKGANKEGSEKNKELKEMKAELAELEKQLGESLTESFSKVTDGILDNVYDAAREFTDAWWDAFAETGDGLKGLEDNFKEMFLNLVKNQATMQITGAYVERWKKDLEKYINADDTELTKEEAKLWAEDVRRTMPQLSNALEGYLGAFKDMAESSEGKLSGLQKGIQGITEDQADILTAYWNSVRGYTASIDSKMDSILASINVTGEDNPMLEQMKIVAKQVSDINTLLNSLVRAGHTKGGFGIKVFTD